MKLQEQVITLEQAKRLKELGVNTHSIFYWQDTHNNYLNNGQPNDVDARVVSHHYFNGDSDKAMFYPAYTVAELGVMLPEGDDCNLFWHSFYNDHQGYWEVDARRRDERTKSGFKSIKFQAEEETEAQARGALLIHLLGNGIITAEQCNASLTP